MTTLLTPQTHLLNLSLSIKSGLIFFLSVLLSSCGPTDEEKKEMAIQFLAEGKLHYENNKYPQALDAFNKCIELDSTNADCYVERSKVKAKNEDLDGMISDLNKAISLDPENYAALYTRGAQYFANNEFYKSIPDFIRLEKLSSKADVTTQCLVLSYLSTAYYFTNQYHKGLEIINYAIAKFPKILIYSNHKMRAMIKYALHDYEGAKRDCYIALAYESGDTDLRVLYGKTYQMTGNLVEACLEYYTAADMGNDEGLELYLFNCRNIY